MTKLVGYARVSTQDQDVQLQLDALKQAGCSEHHIFIDKTSGAQADRPGLEACLQGLKPGDTLLVWRLDRLGRSMPHLVMPCAANRALAKVKTLSVALSSAQATTPKS
jgi:DNA invertase Pin-like site-specific DNA recombinase